MKSYWMCSLILLTISAFESDFSSNEWTATGGLGGKFFVSERIFIGGDFRFGWEPLLRITGSIGYAF